MPVAFLQPREWHIRRPLPERGPLERAVAAIRAGAAPGHRRRRRRALLRRRGRSCARFVEATGIPVGTSQAGGGSLALGPPAVPRRHRRDRHGGRQPRSPPQADVVIGIGTRYSDFTTASRTAFQNPDVTFVNVNVAAFDAYKHGSQLPLIADAREALDRADRARTRRRTGVEPATPTEIAAREGGVGRRWSTAPSRRPAPPCPGSPRSSAPCSRPPTRATSWSRPPARCPATCTSSGGCATRSGTTSSTRSRAWATRSPAASASRAAALRDRDVIVMVGDGSLPDAAHRARHRGGRGHQDHRRAHPEPRLRVDRAPLRDRRLRALRHPVPLPRRDRARLRERRPPARRPRRERPQLRRRRHRGRARAGRASRT